MKRRTPLAAALAAFAALAAVSLGGPAALARTLAASPTAAGQRMTVAIVERASGRELPLYRHRGELWVAGTPGGRYAVRLRNPRSGRMLAVLSVDGVNAVSGETAAVGQTGYVLDGAERADIAGWRKSDREIAAFEFTALAEAYATRTGRPDHVGVIGVAVFGERAAPPPSPPAPPIAAAPRESARESASAGKADAAAEARAAPAPQAAQRLGTGHGAREASVVARTTFERARDQPDELIRIRYDSRENLIAAGIIPRPRTPPAPHPSPFPASEAGYVPDPPGR